MAFRTEPTSNLGTQHGCPFDLFYFFDENNDSGVFCDSLRRCDEPELPADSLGRCPVAAEPARSATTAAWPLTGPDDLATAEEAKTLA